MDTAHLQFPPVFLFVDSEFTDFSDRSPLSIGIAAQDGRRFYVELDDADLDRCSDFVATQVLPLLGDDPAARCDFRAAGLRLRQWLSSYAGRDVVLVHGFFADREIFFDLLRAEPGAGRKVVGTPQEHEAFADLGRELGMAKLLPMDVGTRVNQDAFAHYFEVNSQARRHHSLDDALALMAAFLTHPGARDAAQVGEPHGQ